jgi:tetratricopeptide (TPR) repeat protein
VPDPPFRLERITLTPADGYVLTRLDGKSTARTIIQITPLPKEEVERSLLSLLCTGVIEYLPRDAAPAARTRNPSATLALGQAAAVPRLAADPKALARAVGAAEARLAEGRYQDARVALEAIVPMAEGSLERRARLLLIRCHAASPEGGPKAESELLRLVRLDPRDAEALFALGKFYQAGSQPGRARPLFQKVVELEPGHEAAAAELASLRAPGAAPAGLLDRFRRQVR